MHEKDMKRCLDNSLRALDWTAADSARALAAMKGEIKVKKRMTFVMAVALSLLLILSATALAVTTGWLGKVGEMFSSGKVLEWGLDEKVLFVSAMREAGYEMDEEDLNILMDESADPSLRNAAADRIVDARYGDILREQTERWVEPPETTLGMLPDPSAIFYEAFFREHPEASMQDYIDALDRWQREIAGEAESVEPEPAPVDAETVRQYLRGCMTEILSWPMDAAERAEITVSFNDEFGVWEGVARVDKALVVSEIEMIVDEPYVFSDGKQYVIRAVVGQDGQGRMGVSASEYVAERSAAPVWNLTNDEIEQIAAAHLTARYGVDADALFIQNGDVYTDANGFGMAAKLFKPHRTTVSTDWVYAVIVNGGTGEIMDSFTPDDLWDEARIGRLAAAYAGMTPDARRDHFRFYSVTYNPEHGFRGWSHAHRAQFAALFKPVIDGMLEADPEFNDHFAVEATRRIYGVPGEGDLQENEALALAIRVAESGMGIEPGALAVRDQDVLCTFDATDPENPLWRFVMLSASVEGESPFTYAVRLDARTGETISAFNPFESSGQVDIDALL